VNKAYTQERPNAKRKFVKGNSASEVVEDTLERIAREGARQLIAQMLEAEVTEFLQRNRYHRNTNFRGYRNGFAPERTIGVGIGAVKVRVPRVSDVPKEVEADGYRSRIVSSYQRLGKDTQRLIARLYLEGLSTGDFEPVFRVVLGKTAPLSPASVVRLKADWQTEYEVWQKRRLDEHRYLYVWVDGVYLAAGQEDDKSALLCVIGLREDGAKELLTIGLGYRESTESWSGVLRDLKSRGMVCPLLMVGDGALGIWGALREVWPECRRQRCWNHRALNVLDKLPKRLWGQVRKDIHKASLATSREKCQEQLQELAEKLRQAGQEQASQTVLRDVEDFVTFYDYPEEHWIHLRTTNPIESIFAGVRLRTNVTKRLPNRENGLYLVFKIVGRLSQNWRKITGSNLCGLVLEGKRFENGRMAQQLAA
jgi:putative transposase